MRIIFTLTLLITALCLNARRISADEAMSVANDFLSKKSQTSKKIASLNSETKLSLVDFNDSKPIHAFNISDNHGFVIVTAEGEEPMILGYADKGSFDITNLPPQLKGIIDNPVTFKNAAGSKKASATRSQVLYETAEWGQFAPFNNLCPEYDGVKAPAGCVATAMAITMKYHNWPDYTRGGEEVIFHDQEQKFDFSDYTIDWSALSDKDNPNFANEASKFMYSAGVAARMMYGPQESAAEVWPIGHKMIELYTYAKGAEYIEKKCFSEEEWNELLLKQLDEIGPVIYRGGTESSHCFVIDGYDSEGRFHVNWG